VLGAPRTQGASKFIKINKNVCRITITRNAFNNILIKLLIAYNLGMGRLGTHVESVAWGLTRPKSGPAPKHTLVCIHSLKQTVACIHSPKHTLVFIHSLKHTVVYIHSPKHTLVCIHSLKHTVVCIHSPKHTLVGIHSLKHTVVCIHSPKHTLVGIHSLVCIHSVNHTLVYIDSDKHTIDLYTTVIFFNHSN